MFEANNGKSIRFWDDVWIGHTPLHDLSNNKSGLVCDFFKEGDWQLSFRRSLSPQDVVVWEDLMSRLEMVQLNSDTKLGGC